MHCPATQSANAEVDWMQSTVLSAGKCLGLGRGMRNLAALLAIDDVAPIYTDMETRDAAEPETFSEILSQILQVAARQRTNFPFLAHSPIPSVPISCGTCRRPFTPLLSSSQVAKSPTASERTLQEMLELARLSMYLWRSDGEPPHTEESAQDRSLPSGPQATLPIRALCLTPPPPPPVQSGHVSPIPPY